MPRLDLRQPRARGPLAPQERRMVDVMLALLNEIRGQMGLEPKTEADVQALLQKEEKN